MSTLAVVFSTGVTDGLVNYRLEKVAEALLGDRAASARDTCGISVIREIRSRVIIIFGRLKDEQPYNFCSIFLCPVSDYVRSGAFFMLRGKPLTWFEAIDRW